MKLKIHKFLLLVSLLILSATKLSQAKTVGDFLTLKMSHNDIGSDVSFIRSTGQRDGNNTPTISLHSESSLSSTNQSIGLAYDRALRVSDLDILNTVTQLNPLFVTYGVFYDHLDYSNFANNKNLSINSRYGANIGLGYDLTKKLAIYYKHGFASVDYEVDARSVFLDNSNNETDNNRETSEIIFIGLNYSLLKDILIGFEYSKQEIELESLTFGSTQGAEASERYTYDTEIESFSVNITKKF